MPPTTTWSTLTQPLSASTSTVAGVAFVRDTFSGEAAGTNLNAHTGELGATWAKNPFVNGDIRISSAARIYHATGIDGSFYNASGTTGADYRVIATLHRLSTLPTGIADVLARVSATTDTRYGARYSAVTPGPGWSLYKVVRGTAAGLGVASGETLAVGDSRQVVLEVSGTSVRLYVDGVERVGATDSAITLAGRAGVSLATVVGAQGADATGLQFDNLTAESLPSIVTTFALTPAWTARLGASTAWATTSGASTAWSALT